MRNIVAGNWKMNLGINASTELTEGILKKLGETKTTDVWIAPSFHTLEKVTSLTADSLLEVGSQNVHWEQSGAYTGEISVPMLKEMGCSFALTGHSERRHVLGETDDLVDKRTLGALSQDLKVILCVGETLSEREAGQTNSVLDKQLSSVLNSISESQLSHLVIAYEPVWAIGTGKVASIEEIDSAHTFIASLISESFKGKSVPILYGGSVSPDNFSDIIDVEKVNGALVGGASLSVEKFTKLVEIAEAS